MARSKPGRPPGWRKAADGQWRNMEEEPEFAPRSNLTKVPSGLLGVPTPPRAAATREATPRPAHRIRSKAEPPQEVESTERVTLDNGSTLYVTSGKEGNVTRLPPGRPRIQKSATAKKWRCPGRVWRPRSCHTPLLVVGVLGASGILAPFVRLADQAVELTAAGVEASRAGLDAAANVTSASAGWFVAAVGASRDLSHEAWRGVDLSQVELQYKSGTMVADSSQMLVTWLNSESAAELANFTDDERKTVEALVRPLGSAMPHVDTDRALLKLEGAYPSYSCLTAEGRLLPSGYLALTFRTYRAYFEARWSNPLWEVMEVPLDSEAEQITQAIVSLFQRVTQADSKEPFSEARLATASLPRLIPARLERWSRAGLLAGQQLADTLWSPPWDVSDPPGAALQARW